jgi:hypothetical protein
MRRVLILFSFLLVSGLLMGQTVTPSGQSNQNPVPEIFQRLNAEQDSQLVRLISLHIRKNESIRGIHGFRVEIFFSSALDARQKALQTKAAFLKDFPETNVYVIYVSPDFKVRVGDFRTKNEALAMMKNIQHLFPKAFIVPDIIEYPNLQ